jgi:fluoroacetyl-CoA thioesterase
MKQKLSPGISGILTEVVSIDKTASAVGSGLLDVYSTPSMIALMEKTAADTVQNFLGSGEVTVGSEIHVHHRKASPIGTEITCRARLEAIEGNKLTFVVEAYDNDRLIGDGRHVRHIVDRERFMKKML